MTVLELGAVGLVLAGVFFYLGIFIKVRAILAFVGTCIVTGGLFGSLLTKAAVLVSGVLGTLAGKAFGVAIPGLIVVVLLVIFLHDLHPKKSASGRTFWVGVALAACLVAGVSSWSTLNHVPASVRNGVGNATRIGG
jgi:hypothetical protein